MSNPLTEQTTETMADPVTGMMMQQAWFYRLKAANRDLIKFNGGIRPSAAITSLSTSQIGRCHNVQDPELLTFPAVYHLETACGVPVVTAAMAALHGCSLNDPEQDNLANGCIMAAKAELDMRHAELAVMTAQATADGRLTPSEIHQINNRVAQLSKAVTALQSMLAGALPKGGASTAFHVVAEE